MFSFVFCPYISGFPPSCLQMFSIISSPAFAVEPQKFPSCHTMLAAPVLGSCLAAVGCKDLRLVASRKINGDTQLCSHQEWSFGNSIGAAGIGCPRDGLKTGGGGPQIPWKSSDSHCCLCYLLCMARFIFCPPLKFNFSFGGKMRPLIYGKMGSMSVDTKVFCVSYNGEALVLASIHICIPGNCVEMVRWTFSVDVNDMHYIFHPVRGLFSTMSCAYLHLAGGCCAHNVVVVQLKSQNVITILALKDCAFIKYFENPVNTWMKRMK